MRLLVILAVAVSCKAQFIMPYMGGMQQRVEDAFGTKGFMFNDWNQNRQEMWMRDGSVIGQWSYVDPNGKPVVTYFDAGRHGFRVRSNNLPEALDAEAAAPLALPKPVEDTPEVAEAKKKMAELHEKAASRTKRQIGSYWSKSTIFPMSTFGPAYNPLMSPFSMFPATPMITNVKSRSRREADPLWPTVYSMGPRMVSAKIKTKQLKPVEGSAPADTSRLEITTVEHEVPMYTMPSMAWNPYGLMNPAILPMNI